MSESPQVAAVRGYLLGLQQRIMNAVSTADGKQAISDPWRKEPGEPLQGRKLVGHAEVRRIATQFVCALTDEADLGAI